MLSQPKTVIFILISAVIIWLTRRTLSDIRSHGFYRFFAWEAILAQIIRNVEHWFHEPFSVHQMVSWTLLVLCSYLVIHGTLALRRMGKPSRERQDPLLFPIEKTTQLVTTSIYRYIRHPIYSSLICLTWGLYFKSPDLIDALLAVAATCILFATAKVEVAENVRYFGDTYREYMSRTRMFIPYLF
ncbi:MAG: isoprenylcysteine carboxylmethyltransferase family protein [Candidatus Zixiibacteriota bacterium]